MLDFMALIEMIANFFLFVFLLYKDFSSFCILSVFIVQIVFAREAPLNSHVMGPPLVSVSQFLLPNLLQDQHSY